MSQTRNGGFGLYYPSPPFPARDVAMIPGILPICGKSGMKTLVIAERFQFHCPNQAVGESVAEHVAGIRQLTRHCEFSAYLDDTLRDRFVCGLRSKMIQKKLLMETDLTLQ